MANRAQPFSPIDGGRVDHATGQRPSIRPVGQRYFVDGRIARSSRVGVGLARLPSRRRFGPAVGQEPARRLPPELEEIIPRSGKPWAQRCGTKGGASTQSASPPCPALMPRPTCGHRF